MITLSDGTTSLTLNQLLWPNRSRNRVLGSERVTLGNRLFVQRTGGSAGQEITLEARLQGSELLGWFTWSQVEQLMTWRDDATQLVLNYHSDIRPCMIPLSGVAIEPVLLYSNTIAPDAFCTGTLTLKEV